jgi:hypothetical protein
MGWPPQVGDLLPRAEEAFGVRVKLATYSLDPSHKVGGPKAQGFARLLGITLESIDYLEAELHRAVRKVPICSVRENRGGGLNCVIEFPLRGRGARAEEIVNIKSVWELAAPGFPPRLVTAFPRP